MSKNAAKTKSKRFKSKFAPKLEAMLEYRVARGFKEETHLPSLLNFDKFCVANYPKLKLLTSEVVYAWLNLETAVATNGLTRKATAIRQFALYLNAIDEEAFVFSEKLSLSRQRCAPYIFTDNELSILFAEIDKLPEDKSEPYLNIIVPVMFRLVYTCGLRPHEGREILHENVNLDTGEILLVKTKFKKERIVVMSDDMKELCKRYDLQRRIFGCESEYFFPSLNGSPLSAQRIHSALNRAWVLATVNPLNPTTNKIRVYDLRHRFASARLNHWLDEGRDLMAMLPYLREYMGHNTLNETAYYIHILPENLTKSKGVDWKKLNAMFSGSSNLSKDEHDNREGVIA
jgi:integrase